MPLDNFCNDGSANTESFLSDKFEVNVNDVEVRSSLVKYPMNLQFE